MYIIIALNRAYIKDNLIQGTLLPVHCMCTEGSAIGQCLVWMTIIEPGTKFGLLIRHTYEHLYFSV